MVRYLSASRLTANQKRRRRRRQPWRIVCIATVALMKNTLSVSLPYAFAVLLLAPNPARAQSTQYFLADIPTGKQSSSAVRINDAGQVAMSSGGHAVIWDPVRGLTDLGPGFPD